MILLVKFKLTLIKFQIYKLCKTYIDKKRRSSSFTFEIFSSKLPYLLKKKQLKKIFQTIKDQNF